MPQACERFQAELVRLVAQFEKNFKLYKAPPTARPRPPGFPRSPLPRPRLGRRQPLGLFPRTAKSNRKLARISGRQKRADYLFRTERVDRFVCEATKPAETLPAGLSLPGRALRLEKKTSFSPASRASRNQDLPRRRPPPSRRSDTGHVRPGIPRIRPARPEIWNLLSRDAVAGGPSTGSSPPSRASPP
jgi:hypothetical protein